MTTDLLVDLAGRALVTALTLSAPAVLTALLVGFMISLFQAVTQIQEQTLSFVPKIIAVFVVLLISGPWMVNIIQDFTQGVYTDIAEFVQE